MVAGHGRFDAPLQQAINQAVIKRGTHPCHRPGALGHESRPGDGEAIGTDTEVANEVQVFADAVHVITRRIGVGAIGDGTRNLRKTVPNRLATG